MKKSIFAALFHCASSEKNNWHDHCLKGKDSWCKYQQDVVNDINTNIAGAGLPLSVITHVKPIFLELSEDSLLLKCLHGKTQNQNESFTGFQKMYVSIKRHLNLGYMMLFRILTMGT